jgi:hypothetical protein
MPDWWRCSSPAAASSAIFMHDVQCSGFPLLDGRDPAQPQLHNLSNFISPY